MDAAPMAFLPDLASLIEVNEDATVSRTALKAEGARLVLFAFDTGQGLSEHTAPFDALVNIVDGEVEITISKKAYRLAKGDCIILPAGEPHALKAISRFKMLLVMIRS